MIGRDSLEQPRGRTPVAGIGGLANGEHRPNGGCRLRLPDVRGELLEGGMSVVLLRHAKPVVERRARDARVGGGFAGEGPEAEGIAQPLRDVARQSWRSALRVPSPGTRARSARSLVDRASVAVMAPPELPLVGMTGFEEVGGRAPLATRDSALEVEANDQGALCPRAIDGQGELLEARPAIRAPALGDPAVDGRRCERHHRRRSV
jgi:hypothetical protein